LVILLSAASIELQAQTKNCAKFKNGKFKMLFKGITILIERNGNYQREEAVELKKTVSYKVTWIDDCHYTLTPFPDAKARLKTPKSLIISVSIDRLTDSSYFQTSTENYSNLILKGEIVKLKK
jgi:hypothetical protein